MIKPKIYVAPTEPPQLRSIGKITLLPETMGCDVLAYYYNPLIVIGFQRKRLDDFIASIQDGRLTKELGQIEDSHQLSYSCLIIEGRPIWTNDGRLSNVEHTDFTRSGFRGLLSYIQSRGVIIHITESIGDTIDCISELSRYLAKPSHNTLLRRPKTSAKNSWGRSTSNAFASHVLQSFPGIGPSTAESIFTTFGRIPLQWTATESELTNVPGIGKKMARGLLESLE